tara:strand:- start:1341 stop:2018 length:678 start_codon:yes stop_codon:yes gene_type:complete
MSNKNLGLWDQVESTDAKFTHKLQYGAKLTAIDAQYQRKRATEMFGPMGIGWGTTESTYVHNQEFSHLYFTAKLWYVWEGTKGQIEIASDIPSKPDCYKSVRTDAITKGLSELGFNADVFMGTFDGNKYMKEDSVLSENEAIGRGSSGEVTNSPSASEEPTMETLLDFGKHSDKLLKDVPLDYLSWLVGQKDPSPKVAKWLDIANKELHRRKTIENQKGGDEYEF